MRWLAGVALWLSVFAADGSAARPPSDAVLLARHVPVLRLHPEERFRPAPVDGFLADSDLAAGRYDQRACSARDGLAALGCYADAEAAHGAPPTAYAAAFRTRTRIVLEYWLFYPYNLWSPTVPQSAEFWQAHEGDWELVAVVLDAAGRPLEVAASRHCAGARRAWAGAPREGARPVVHVALGSHAHYFAAGQRVVEARCWPKEAVAIYRGYDVPMLDHAAAGPVVRALRLVRVSPRSPAWMAFAGAWGEDQYAGFPNHVFRFGTGPRGPASHASWRKPVATLASWPLER